METISIDLCYEKLLTLRRDAFKNILHGQVMHYIYICLYIYIYIDITSIMQ